MIILILYMRRCVDILFRSERVMGMKQQEMTLIGLNCGIY